MKDIGCYLHNNEFLITIETKNCFYTKIKFITQECQVCKQRVVNLRKLNKSVTEFQKLLGFKIGS